MKRSVPVMRPSSTRSSVPSSTSRLRSVSAERRSSTSSASRVEAKKSSLPAVPIQSGRPTARARKRTEAFALVEPGGRHRAVQLLERLGAALGVLGEGEDRLGVDGHLRMRALEAVAGEDLLVVDDDPVVDPDDRAVPDRVVVRLDRRMALRVVANVHEHLRGRRRARAPRPAARWRRSGACGRSRRRWSRGGRTRPRPRRARRFRPAGPARRASAARSTRGSGCIRQFRT